MKRLISYISVIVLLVITQNAFSQKIGDLNGIYYQAVAIDENGKEIVGMDIEGKPLYKRAIGVRFSITKGLDGDIQWEETQDTIITDEYGLFTVIIGQGAQTGNGTYSKMLDIPWIDADQWLKVEIATKNDSNYKLVSNQQFMSVPYAFYADDIADDAVTTAKILDATIINQDVQTSAVDSRTILNETILAEDINTGAVTTSEILNATIINEDVQTSAVDSRTILNETILAEDINTGAVTTSEILNVTIINEDIQTSAVDSRTILDETIANNDIADNTINLSTKVTDTLAVVNGGTGNGSFTSESILVGNGTNAVLSKILASADSSLIITQTADSIILQTAFAATEVTSDPAGTFVIGNLPAGSTYTSNAINSFAVDFGDIIIGSIDANLQGCMLTAYVSNPNVIRVAIYNGTGGPVNLGTVNLKIYVVN